MQIKIDLDKKDKINLLNSFFNKEENNEQLNEIEFKNLGISISEIICILQNLKARAGIFEDDINEINETIDTISENFNDCILPELGILQTQIECLIADIKGLK